MEALAAETPIRSKRKMYVREYAAIMKTILVRPLELKCELFFNLKAYHLK